MTEGIFSGMKDGRMLGRATVGKAEFNPPDLVETLLAAAHATAPIARVLTIAGPPRSGKSRALAQFVRRCGADAFELSLTEDDTSLFAFLFALVRCIGPVARGAQLSFSAMQTRLSSADCVPQIVAWLCAHIDAHAWVAVDNVELLERDSPVARLLLEMVERCPRVRWLFAGRTLEPLPMGTWKAQRVCPAPFTTQATQRAPIARLLARLDSTERELLAALAPLRTLEPSLIGTMTGDAGALIIRRLYERAPELFEINGTIRLHRDVRDALLRHLAETGNDVLQSIVARCGTTLEAFECHEELLQMYLRNQAYAQLEDLLARRGLFLADHVNADTLDAALRAVPGDSPGARSLQAMLASRRGQYDLADFFFETAARDARQPLSAQIDYAYGCDLLRRSRSDSAPIFERLLNENVPGAVHQSEIRSAYAQALVFSEQPGAALEQIKFALHVLGPGADARVVKTRAAYVFFHAAHDLTLAEQIASDALAQALQARTYTIAVSAASLLSDVASEYDRPDDALAALNLLADCGIKLGDVAVQSYAVIGMLEYHVEAGDVVRIQRAREALQSFDISYDSPGAPEALVAAEAMQRSWRGDFARAYDLLERAVSQAIGQDYRALREAQSAFYAAAAGRPDASRRHARRSLAALDTLDSHTHKAVRARILLGVALSAIGNTPTADDQFRLSAEPSLRFARLSALRDGAISVHERLRGNRDDAAFSQTSARMKACGAGGFARMFDEFARLMAR